MHNSILSQQLGNWQDSMLLTPRHRPPSSMVDQTLWKAISGPVLASLPLHQLSHLPSPDFALIENILVWRSLKATYLGQPWFFFCQKL